MPPSRLFDQGGHDVIATMIWCAKKRFDAEFHRFFDVDVCDSLGLVSTLMDLCHQR